jgi:glycerol kinase
MALQNADILRAMQRDLGKKMKPLRVDGGAAVNDLLMQIQSDVLGHRLIRPAVTETTVAGACYLAGLAVGIWDSPAQVRKIWKAEREFRVKMNAAARRKRLASWDLALQRTLL